jgi:1,4-dihydroxy-2-naphthoyl-CoA hydrolase
MNVLDIGSIVPFAAVLGMDVEAATPQEVRGRMPWAAERCTSAGVMHGGALIAFADTLGAVCAYLNLPEGATTATIESKTNLFRAVRDGVVEGVARPLHVGRSFIVVQTQLENGGKSVAQVTQTQAVLIPEGDE